MALPSGTPSVDQNSVTTTANLSLDQAVFLERTKLLFSNIPATIVATLIVAPAIIYINWNFISHTIMLFWAMYMALTMVYRFSIFTLFKKKMSHENLHIWPKLFLFGTIITATGWGITGTHLILSDSLQQHMFTTMILAGLSAGGLATLTPLYSAVVCFTLFNMTPLMLTMISFGTGTHYTTSFLVFVFMAYMIISSARMAKTIHESISLRFQHDDALKDLAEEKQQTDELNINLKQQINERRIIEQHLEYSMSQLKATLESATDGILVIDNNEQVTSFNQNFIDLFKIPDTLMEMADFSQIQRHINAHLENKNQPSAINSKELVLLRLDDGRLIETVSKPQKIGEQIIGNVLSYRDATMRINSESSLQEAKTRAEIANKEKSDFLSRISHELRTPMNAILGFGHLLQENEKEHLDNDEKDFVSHICVAGTHLLHLIDDLLDISRIESGKLNINLCSVSCKNIISESMTLVQPSAQENNISISFKTELTDMPFIQADHTRCKQALVNLLSNAIKYNKKNGSVTLTVSASESHVRFEIKDTGIGISEENFHEIFQPFIRLKQTGTTKGTGIGLTITKRLIDVMNGTIGVDSKKGSGSTFWFELPKALEQDAAVPVHHIEHKQHTFNTMRKPHTILYVEDEPLNRALIASIVKQIPNTKLITASTGEEGLEIAISVQPDLILMDINLPGISGYEVLKTIKGEASFANTPVFALSANAMPEEINRGKEAGFFDYLIKPINIDNTRLLLSNTLSMIENGLIKD